MIQVDLTKAKEKLINGQKKWFLRFLVAERPRLLHRSENSVLQVNEQAKMSCLDCWEWFVEFVIRCEREGSPYLKPKEPVDPSDKSQGNGSGSKRPSQVETESLSTTDTDFKKERFRQLFNKHGFNLAIFPGGNVRGAQLLKPYKDFVLNLVVFVGVREAFNPHAVLEILPISVGEVRIRGAETGIYLAMNPNGTLYGEPSPSGDESVFIESTNGPYLVYLRL